MLNDWIDLTARALFDAWDGFIMFVPRLLGALIVFLIGWAIAAGIGKLVAEILKQLKLNTLFENEGWKKALQKAEVQVNISSFVGAIFKWLLIIVFLSIAVEILGLMQFAGFLNTILAYLPNVVVAVLIFVVAVIISDILEKVVRAAVEGAKVGYGKIAGTIVKYSLWIFAFFAMLDQLNIARNLINTLQSGIVYGVVIFFALGGAIALGLGGKDAAREAIDSWKKRLQG